MKIVNDLLNTKAGLPIPELDATTTVIDALTFMESENLSYVVVTNRGAYAGIFSQKDYAQKVVLMNKNSYTSLIGEALSTDLPAIDLDDTTQTCWMLMTAYKTTYLPAFHNFSFRGVVTITDVLNEAMLQVDAEPEGEKVF